MTAPMNYEPQIHDGAYRAEYIRERILARTLIHTSGRPYESLNGIWNFAIDQYDTCIHARWYEEKSRDGSGRLVPLDYDFTRWERIPVPSCWNTIKDKYFYYEGPGAYTRTFLYKGKEDERVFLHFDGAQYETFVFLNGKYLGCHRGGSTPFSLELTGKLLESNRILVVTDSTRKPTQVPAENTDWFNYGGLYRGVRLFRVPETFIRDTFIRLEPGSGGKTITADITLDGLESGIQGEAVLEIPELGLRKRFPVTHGSGTVSVQAEPELWHPENPRLYDVMISFGSDTIRERIGFREISVKGNDILLNGKPVYLKGMSAHEESVSNGKALTEKEQRETLVMAKELGCNYLRLAHYPHSEKMALFADELGIMLWEEIPVYWAIDFKNGDTYADAENQLTELIVRDRNRASVIIWSVGNENADTDERLAFMSGLALKAKELDPTRPVSAACLVNKEKNMIEDRLEAFLDIIGLNEYFGWYDPHFEKLTAFFTNSRPAKPVIVCEFGAGARAGNRGTKDEFFTEECQKYIYERQIETLKDIPYVKGMSPWILYDFRCPRRTNGYQEGYNRKGLYAEDKKTRKSAYTVMKEFYSRR